MSRYYHPKGLDYSTELVQTSWLNCSHPFKIRYGFRSGKQLWRCIGCGKCQVENRARRQHETIVRLLADCFKAGMSQCKARKIVRVNGVTTKKYYKLFEEYLAK